MGTCVRSVFGIFLLLKKPKQPARPSIPAKSRSPEARWLLRRSFGLLLFFNFQSQEGETSELPRVPVQGAGPRHPYAAWSAQGTWY